MIGLHEAAIKVSAYVANLNSNLDRVVLSVDWKILDLNRQQMKERQVTAKGNPITPEYSSYWKAKKGLTFPNLYDTGSFQKKFVLNVHYPQYEIHSTDVKNDKLRAKYERREPIFGIAPYNRTAAYAITNKAIAEDFRNKCFK